MLHKYSVLRTAITSVALLALWPGILGAWTRASHGQLAATAMEGAKTFENYASQQGLGAYVVQAVQDADNESEKVFTADLEKSYPGIRMIKGDDPTKVQHTSPVLAYHLPDDTRLHNALECLKISRELRLKATTPVEHHAAMRIFADGLHLVQDYFAHLNAPGRGKTGFSHGVGNLIDTNGDGTPDTPAGKVVDNVNWDCFSDYGNDFVPAHLRIINYFYSPFWHKHSAKEQGWRFQAALHAGMEYMECYLAEDGLARFTKALTDGHVIHDGERIELDLITHIVVDNSDKACQLSGDWKALEFPGSYMAKSAFAEVKDPMTVATWSVSIPLDGRYDIYMRWPESSDLSSKATAIVRHAGESRESFVNQRTNVNRWNLLGRFNLRKGRKLSVLLTGQIGDRISADAVLLDRIPD